MPLTQLERGSLHSQRGGELISHRRRKGVSQHDLIIRVDLAHLGALSLLLRVAESQWGAVGTGFQPRKWLYPTTVGTPDVAKLGHLQTTMNYHDSHYGSLIWIPLI